MRLINADALIADIKECIEAKYDNYEYKQAEGLKVALSCVDYAPTIEPERKKGKWIRRIVDSGFNADWYCSKCGWRTALEEHCYKFCPNCGSYNGGDNDES